jgi:hypothetical protein
MRTEEIIAIVEVYVHHATGKNIPVRPDLPREMPLLLKAYSKAIDWIDKNNIKLTLIY